MYCEKCGAPNEEGVKFCTSCGGAMGAQPDAVNNGGEAAVQNSSKKLISTIIAIAVLVVVVLLGYKLVSGIFGGADKDNYEKHPVFFVTEDGDFQYVNAGKKEALFLTDDDKAVEYYEGDYSHVRVSKDGKKFCYVKEIDDDGEKTLYLRSASDKEGAKEIEIDDNVNSFRIAPNGKFVIYEKNDSLYYSNGKTNFKIEKDASLHTITEDSKYIIYYEKDEKKVKTEYGYENTEYIMTYYVRSVKENAEAEEIDSEIGNLIYMQNKDGEYVNTSSEWYYEKEDNLYYKKSGKDAVKLISDLGDVDYINGVLFATEKDYVEIKEKENDDYSGLNSLDTDSEKEGIQIENYTLYKIDGTKVSEPILENIAYTNFGKQLAAVFAEDIDGNKYKDIEEYNKDVVDEMLLYAVKSDGKIVSLDSIDFEETKSYEVSDDEKYFYIIEELDVEKDVYGNEIVSNIGVLNRYKIKGNKLDSKKETLAEDVYSYTIFKDFVIITSKDDDDFILGVYRKGKYEEITSDDYDIVQYFIDENIFYFLDDYDRDDREGVLKKYSNGKIEEIAQDVYDDISFRSSKFFYYLQDYDTDDKSGTLLVCKGKKSKEIAQEVAKIVYFY